MQTRKLYDPKFGQMKLGIMISGSGSNAEKIIERQIAMMQGEGSPYKVVAIFSDNPKSRAKEIGLQYRDQIGEIPVIVRDIEEFYRERGMPIRDMSVREEFDRNTKMDLLQHGVQVIAYAGYMKKVTKPLVEGFLGINVHPADLSLMNGDVRKYDGDKAVRKAILAGEKKLCSTTHIVEGRVDYGRILMISAPSQVELPAGWESRDEEMIKRVCDENQERLKVAGDWVIFPKTLEFLARGDYSFDSRGVIYYKDQAIPKGGRWGKEIES